MKTELVGYTGFVGSNIYLKGQISNGYNTKNIEEKVLAISHVNCLERAKWVKDEILKLAKFKDITIADTAGVSTLYANDGGIIVAV